MKTLDATLLNSLVSQDPSPSLSIYLPVHKNLSESPLDILSLKNLIKDIRTQVDPSEIPAVETLLEPVERLLNDKNFARGKAGTLAIFSSPGLFETVLLPDQYPAAFYLDDCFYIVPLLAFAGSNTDFHVLALGKNRVRLFEGNLCHFEEIPLEDRIPTTMEQALGSHLTENHIHGATGGATAIHGYMEITDEKETDNTRFFRIIDREIDSQFSRGRKIPLILAALPENISLFHSLSKNECLVREGIALNADGIDTTELHQRALDIMENMRQVVIERHLNRYNIGKSEQLASDVLADIAVHAMDGRIERLFVAKGKRLPGTVSIEDRTLTPDPNGHGDIINKIAWLTYKNGGTIHALDNAEGAFPEGIGALNRF
ncbi:hypothetical protein BC792_11671 [Sphingobacterium allocomposti]|jgi:hypothetical protein|uniref:Uncharacterized protein n=1 Tax=Sphingobacterium allocomposti TaxID=415956 RepID=A0A5S5DCX6_9SPHI|nr:hypothetical protein [Sphingobacterium composti Yoo et al. 2007 non Ten et al. 2007]TYP92469.1 hypothetical protein BC792_11671 [Sphingobacterium composti Yoo et al. 2007 non Ten et al. 2007]HLS95913.1 hypothetical protein [Sphingobacterium sp.]